MQAGIIVNPYAGRSGRIAARTDHRGRLAREALASCGVRGEVAFTGHRGTARALARSLVEAGATSLVCWGGDGTVNEVASEAARHGLPLGIVPGGSGNGLARELGLDRQPEAALRTALRGPERILDAGEIDGRFFANVAGVGFDAHVARLAERFERRGAWSYFAAGIPELLAYRAGDLRHPHGRGRVPGRRPARDHRQREAVRQRGGHRAGRATGRRTARPGVRARRCRPRSCSGRRAGSSPARWTGCAGCGPCPSPTPR